MLTYREQQERKKDVKNPGLSGPSARGGYAFCVEEKEVLYRQDAANGASRRRAPGRDHPMFTFDPPQVV